MSQDTQAPIAVDLTDPALDDTDRALIALVGTLAEHPATPLPARQAVDMLQQGVLRTAQRHAAIMDALRELHDLVTAPKAA